MRKLVLAAIAVSVIASPALAKSKEGIVSCVSKISMQLDGKVYNLRHNEDFKVITGPYGETGVVLKQRIEASPHWRHARGEAKKCQR
jgi:hypothetical protein